MGNLAHAHGGGAGRLFGAIAVAVLVGALQLETARVRGRTSGTYDETIYRQVAHDIAVSGTVRPAVDIGVAPLPVLLAWWPGAHTEPTADTYVEQIAGARLRATWLFGVPLIVTAFVWCARAHGWFAGMVAGGLLVLSPNLLAHASLATTDACVTSAVLAALAVLTWYLRARSLLRALALGLALGCAGASKYSGLFLVIAAIVAMWSRRPAKGPALPSQRTLTLDAAVFAVAFLALWGLHGWLLADVMPARGLTPAHLERFGVSPADAATATRIASTPLPAMVRGILYQINHDRAGHTAFLLGQVSSHGWWYYFPTALLLKSTVVELVAFGLFVVAVAVSWRRSLTLTVLGIAAAIFMGLSLVSHLNIGVRYVLPLLPIATVGAVLFAGGRLRHRPRLAMAAGVGALVAQALSFASITPHHLSFFNLLAGGPSAGYQLLSDSNIDWGQDLPAMRTWQTRTGASPVALSYFGTAPLAAYGVEWTDWRAVSPERADAPRWLVVSATHLAGLYLCGDPFQALRPLAADARIGYSMLAFSLERREVREALEKARQSECVDPT